MKDFLLTLLNAGVSGSIIILIIMLVRLAFRKAPKWLPLALWAMAGVRLILPFTVESPVSLMPSYELMPASKIAAAPTEMPVYSAAPVLTDRPVLTENPVSTTVPRTTAKPDSTAVSITEKPAVTARPSAIIGNTDETNTPKKTPDIYTVLFIAWAAGFCGICLYSAISYASLKRKLSTAVLVEGNVYESEFVASPFLLGLFRPRIYLPTGLDEGAKKYVLAHESSHIAALDFLWKPLGFLILGLHWFNPVVWMGYIFFCRDMEAACDERVIRGLENEERAEYLEALLKLSVKRRRVAACPLAFGENNIKERVNNVINYRKPALWLVLAAVAVCCVFAACFMTDPKKDNTDTTAEPTNYPTYSPTDETGEVPEKLRAIVEGNLFTEKTAAKVVLSYRGVYPSADRVVVTDVCGTGTKLSLYDSYGNLLAEHIEEDAGPVVFAAPTSDGGFVYAGYSKYVFTDVDADGSVGPERSDSFMVKCKSDGSVDWSAVSEGKIKVGFEHGGTWYFFGEQERVLDNGNIVVSILMLKVDSTGGVVKRERLDVRANETLLRVDETESGFLLHVLRERTDVLIYSLDIPANTYMTIEVNEELETIGEKQGESEAPHSLLPVGVIGGKKVYFDEVSGILGGETLGGVKLIFEYDDYYLAVSENMTDVYREVSAEEMGYARYSSQGMTGFVPSFTDAELGFVLYRTETVYSVYTKEKKLVCRRAYDSTPDYEASVIDGRITHVDSRFNRSYAAAMFALADGKDPIDGDPYIEAYLFCDERGFYAYAARVTVHKSESGIDEYYYTEPVLELPYELYDECARRFDEYFGKEYPYLDVVGANDSMQLYTSLVNGDSFMLRGDVMGNEQIKVIYFNDNGVWREFGNSGSNHPHIVTGYCVMNSSTGFICYRDGDGFDVYKSSDGGVNWRNVSVEIPNDYAGFSLTALSPVFSGSRGVMPVEAREGNITSVLIFESTDGGESWNFKRTAYDVSVLCPTPSPDGGDVTAHTIDYAADYKEKVLNLYYGDDAEPIELFYSLSEYLYCDGETFKAYSTLYEIVTETDGSISIEYRYGDPTAEYPVRIFEECCERYREYVLKTFPGISVLEGDGTGVYDALVNGDSFLIKGEYAMYRQPSVLYFNDGGEWREFGNSNSDYPYPVTGYCVKDADTAFICYNNVLEADFEDDADSDDPVPDMTACMQFFASFDGGETWERLSLDIPEEYLCGIYGSPKAYSPVFDLDRGILPVIVYTEGAKVLLLFESTDGGHTWSFVREVWSVENK